MCGTHQLHKKIRKSQKTIRTGEHRVARIVKYRATQATQVEPQTTIFGGIHSVPMAMSIDPAGHRQQVEAELIQPMAEGTIISHGCHPSRSRKSKKQKHLQSLFMGTAALVLTRT